MDPLETETARFWENHGEYNDVDPAKIQTEVIQLPSTCFAEDEGSLTNSGRWLQWHWAGGTPPGEAKTRHLDHGADLSAPEGALRKEGGAVPEPILNLDWPYKDPNDPQPEELAKEINGYVVENVTDPERSRPRSCSRRASRWPASPRCATTARRRAAAGSTPAASTRRATTWPAATQRSRRHRRSIRNGRSRGRPTGASSTTARRPTSTASRGIRPASCIEWDGAEMDRLRRAGHRADRQAGRGRPVHHEPGRRRRACSPAA